MREEKRCCEEKREWRNRGSMKNVGYFMRRNREFKECSHKCNVLGK
jgi:hypothetical protein